MSDGHLTDEDRALLRMLDEAVWEVAKHMAAQPDQLPHMKNPSYHDWRARDTVRDTLVALTLQRIKP